MTPPPSAARGSWFQVAAGFTVLFVASGVNFSFGILFKPILAELGSDRATLALAATASLLVNAAGQPLFGALIDRFGPRRVILPSLGLMALGTGLVALAGRPWQVVLLYGVVAGVGNTGAGILPISVHVSRWFPGERGGIMAVAATGFSLGHLVFTQVAAHAALWAGWRAAYGLLAGILIGFGLAIVPWLRDAPGAVAAVVRPGTPLPASRAPQAFDRRAALRTAGFWAMTGGLMGCGFTDFLLTTHLAPFATDLGLSPAVAANAVSLWAAANVAGILIAGSLAGRVGPRPALVLTYLLRAASLLFLPWVRESWQLYLFGILFGATFFTTAPLSATLTGRLFGPTHQGTIFGAANLFHHSAGALGALAGGIVFDRTGSYAAIFLASGFLVIGSALVTALARPPRRVAPQAP
jgi:MFS family permease